ncbi:hypothetical protein HYFRA_00006273 [Hymenoscyphus fraxineus]|uniref:C2H2-type domain-containing protein n=1 Tax=Hymenoscyphus fraxineus TaxID=746836 RepID=A0A9N9PVT7_9HELO|nr:hypothetical protein HYFRA_00006273 [Hymenoscyphus fraxineus]
MHKFFCTNSGCGAYFHSSEELGSHIRKSHHHRCDICETIFPEIQGLLDHKDSVHKYRCDHDGCGATFTTLGRRVFHSETHRRACDKCKDTFPSVESLIEHRDKAHLFRCDHEGCSALFYNPESRNIHLRINHRHKCDKCKGIFSTVQGLLEHRDSTHLFSCEASGCDAHFSTQSALESHLTVHQHICPKCTKVFSTAVDLSKHIASTHRFRCKEEDCWAWFDRVDGLKKHIELHEKVSNKASMESRATQTEDLFVLNKVSMETRDTQTEDLFYDTEENETGSSVCSEPDLRSDASELSTSPPTSATTPTYIYLNSAPNPFFKTPVSLENASHRSKIPSATGEQDIDSITPRSSLHYTPSDAEDFMDKLVEDLEKFSLSSRN